MHQGRFSGHHVSDNNDSNVRQIAHTSFYGEHKKKYDNGLYYQRHIDVHPCRALDGPHMGTNLRCGWVFRWRLLPDAAEYAAMVAIRDAVVPPLRRPISKTRTAAQNHEIAFNLDQTK